MKNAPPSVFLNFFRWYCHPRLVDHIEGDLIEVYRRRLTKMSKRKADIKFMVDVILLLRPGIIRPPQSAQNINRYGMYRNYLTVTFRVLNRELLYSLVNVSGLAVGFSCCLLIYLFISDELSYDRFHHDGARIYRIGGAYMRQGQWEPYATNAWKAAELIKNNYSEVEAITRIMPDNNTLFEYGDKRILENRLAWVDDNFLQVFNFPLTQGNPTGALKGSNRVVISESMAAKYFGSNDPMGLIFKLSDYPIELQVSGVMKDMPSNSHFHFDFLISGETLRQVAPKGLFNDLDWDSQYLYARLHHDADPARMDATFPEFVDRNMDVWTSATFRLFLQPLEAIHLRSNVGREIEANGNMTRVYTFTIIAVFILLIACVNYMNLTTARGLRRAKEVGMRKVLGARRPDLLGQFLMESFIMTTMAVLLAVSFCLLLLPSFNAFAGKSIQRDILFRPDIMSGLLVFMLAVAVLSGFYPAMMLSSFKPLNSMKMGSGSGGRVGLVFRKGLVLLQFVISIGLIAASAIVFKQWNFMKNKELGINEDMVVSVPLQTMDRRKADLFANEMLANPLIRKTGFSNFRMPGWIGNSTGYTAQDVDADREVNKSMKIIRIDCGFLPTIEAQVVRGRNFAREFGADSVSSVILNETALEQLGWNDAIGKWIQFDDVKHTVVGVVKDFHFESLHRKIPPTIFVFQPRAFSWLYLKIDKDNIPAALEHVKKVYGRYVSTRDFTYTFLDQDIEQQYVAEEKFTEVFTVFTGLAIAVACLGTFGLISFSAERKAKEIGIRKVLGASVGDVSFMLMREFVLLLLIASLIAWPVTYYFLNHWIEGFTYRTPIGAMPFIAATLAGAFVVVMTTAFRAVKAALANPVESLKDE